MPLLPSMCEKLRLRIFASLAGHCASSAAGAKTFQNTDKIIRPCDAIGTNPPPHPLRLSPLRLHFSAHASYTRLHPPPPPNRTPGLELVVRTRLAGVLQDTPPIQSPIPSPSSSVVLSQTWSKELTCAAHRIRQRSCSRSVFLRARDQAQQTEGQASP